MLLVRGIHIFGKCITPCLVWNLFPTLCMLYLASTIIKALLIMTIIGKAALSQVGNWPRQFPPGQYCTLLYTPSIYFLQGEFSGLRR